MGLNFKGLRLSEWVHHNLYAARFVGLAHTREECSWGCSIVHHLDLVQADVLLKASNLQVVLYLTNRLVLAGGKD